MPGFFPGRPGGEHDEPLLDMILERRPIPPGAPPEIHGLAHMLAAVAGPAGPGELTGEAATLAAFTRLRTPAGISHAVPRSARRPVPEWGARGRLCLAAGLTAIAAGLGGTAAAYAGVLPGPIQHLAHEIIGAPAPHHDVYGHAPAVAGSPTRTQRAPTASAWPGSHKPASSALDPGHGKSKDRRNGLPGYGPGENPASCQPTPGGPQNQNHGQGRPSPTPASVTKSPHQVQSHDQTPDSSKTGPDQKPTPQQSVTAWVSPTPTVTACPSVSPAASRPGP
jgi:hypothetical protein